MASEEEAICRKDLDESRQANEGGDRVIRWKHVQTVALHIRFAIEEGWVLEANRTHSAADDVAEADAPEPDEHISDGFFWLFGVLVDRQRNIVQVVTTSQYTE